MGGGKGNDRLSLSSQHGLINGWMNNKFRYDVIKIVEGRGGAQVPTQLVKHDKLPLPDILQADGEVCVHDQLLAGNRSGLLELGAEEETDGAEQLELRLLYATPGQETVHEVHGEAEDLRLAAQLLANL